MEQRRKGESEGKRLTPGERFLNWCKAFAVIIPLLGIGWASNTETVKDFVYPQPDIKPVVHDEKPIEQMQCPTVNVTCPTIDISGSINSHEKEFHQ